MIEAPPEVTTDAAELPGIVCRACGGNRWEVTHTRKGTGVLRRWRTCLGCGHRIRTREAVEADAHPDRDAA